MSNKSLKEIEKEVMSDEKIGALIKGEVSDEELDILSQT